MSKSEAIRHLKRVRDQIQGLEGHSTDSQEFFEWRRSTRIAIENAFGKDSDEGKEFGHVSFYPPAPGAVVIGLETNERALEEKWRRESYMNGLSRSRSLLNSMIEQILTYGLEENDPVTSHNYPKETKPTSTNNSNFPLETETVKVFISHSSKDEKLVSSIVDLIEKSTKISSKDIRCSSLDGYRLPGGVKTTEYLRTEVNEFELLIGLITPNALKSFFVVFELGARWGAGKLMVPLLASGATSDDLEGPLAEINALECDNDSQVIQFTENVARYLDVEPEPASSYIGEVASVIQASTDLHEEIQQEQTHSLFDHITSIATEILLDATEDRSGSIQHLRTMGGSVHLAAGRTRKTTTDHRIGSEWKSAIGQLENEGWVIDDSGNGTIFEVTGEGYAVADELRKQT